MNSAARRFRSSEVWCGDGDKGCRPEKWFLIPGREEKGRFYLTAHPALLDKEDEWWYDAERRVVTESARAHRYFVR